MAFELNLRQLLTDIGFINPHGGELEKIVPKSLDEIQSALIRNGLEVTKVYKEGDNITPENGKFYFYAHDHVIEANLPYQKFL